MFPLIQLPRKSEADYKEQNPASNFWFPLIQLPRKSEVKYTCRKWTSEMVSINSTSEEVRSVELEDGTKVPMERFH